MGYKKFILSNTFNLFWEKWATKKLFWR